MVVKNQRNRQTALFLGAGASAAFGYPVTGELLSKIKEALVARTLFSLVSNRKRENAKMERLRKYLTTFFPAFFEREIDLPLVTEVLSLIDFLLSTGEIGIPMMSTKAMEDFRALLEQAVLETIDQASSNQKQAALRHRLTDWILNAPEESGVPLTIVSTNYDDEIEGQLVYKIVHTTDFPIENQVDFGFTWKEGKKVNHRPVDPRVRIFKLHGSFNWLKCPLCGFIYVNPYVPSFREAFREDKIDHSNTCDCGHGPFRTLIIAPSMVRSRTDPDLLTVWRSALESLRTADEWIIAGYSLPPEDIAIRSILIRAYHGRGRDPKPPIVRVIQKESSAAAEGRYRFLFPQCRFEYGGFEAFARSLPPQRKEWMAP